jgi:hypothetical protein
MEANHLWFGQPSIEQDELQQPASDTSSSSICQTQGDASEPDRQPSAAAAAAAAEGGSTAESSVEIEKIQERSAQRAAELEAARAELAALNAQLRQSGKSLRGVGTVKLDEMMAEAAAASASGVLRPSPHSGCETVVVSS